MWYDSSTSLKTAQRQELAMDVLWGAWVKEAKFHERSTDILGIYEEICLEGKRDFPHITDLHLVLAFSVANTVELGQTFEINLDFADRFGIYHPFNVVYQITVPNGDLPMRWYEPYKFRDVLIREPDHYFLNVSIERQFKLSIPLWVTAPKGMIYDPERDSTIEFWPEDFENWKEYFTREGE